MISDPLNFYIHDINRKRSISHRGLFDDIDAAMYWTLRLLRMKLLHRFGPIKDDRDAQILEQALAGELAWDQAIDAMVDLGLEMERRYQQIPKFIHSNT